MWLILKVKCRTLQFTKLWSSSKNAMAKNAIKRKRKERWVFFSFLCEYELNTAVAFNQGICDSLFAIPYALSMWSTWCSEARIQQQHERWLRQINYKYVSLSIESLYSIVLCICFFYKEKEWEISCEKSRHKLFVFFFVNADSKVSTILSVHAI